MTTLGNESSRPDEQAFRRRLIELVAAHGIHTDCPDLSALLQAICVELKAVSLEAEGTTARALATLGAMVAGLYGEPTASDDEVLQRLNRRGRDLHQRTLAKQV